ncbi:phage shock protein A (PspA) family protein [Chthonomonas calidirosea]|uniref:Gfo/Idh/MocA family oxidoreductase n=1 Tax=Chthonomonas calidirosea TaxID=454171 RepID=UPI0006DD3F15|nr:Gfo/Idh/MocA family oxidoreductase [Chthonomonas calidirosea]CEK13833.1 phage shock protein A (PspA) family protein [Chthonomonas calidirosea]
MNPETSLQEAIEQTKRAIEQLRERVVTAIMQRNRLQEEVTKRERDLAIRKEKLVQASKLQDPSVANELREEIATLEKELQTLKDSLAKAEVEAETLKAQRPAEEARLNLVLRDLQARLAMGYTTVVENRQPGSGVGETEEMFQRASDKIEGLQSEAAARQEVTGASPHTPSPTQSAEQLLSDLERRLGLSPTETPATQSVEPAEPSSSPLTAASPEAEPAVSEPPIAFEAPTSPEEPSASIPVPEGLAQSTPFVTGITPEEMEALLSHQSGQTESTSPSTVDEQAVQSSTSSWDYTTSTTASSETLEVISFPVEEEQMEPPQATIEGQDIEASQPIAMAETATVEAPAAPITGESPSATIAPEGVEQPKEEVAFHPATQPRPKPVSYDPSYRVRVAAIGTGGIFRGAHLPCYPLIPQAKLVALCDPDQDALQQAYRRLQNLTAEQIERARERHDDDAIERLMRDLDEVRLFSDISEVIHEVQPDLVDICTQPVLHVPLAIKALEAGIHVMCEKPLCRSWLESERLIATIQRTGRFYQHNENWLFDPDYYTASKLIHAGAIGEPLLMFLATAHGGPEGNPKFWNPEFGGGGSLLDNGIHAIGAAWFLSGLKKRPTMVKAVEPFGMTIRMPLRIIDGHYQTVTVDDDAHILIRFEDADTGAWTNAHVEGSWSHRDSPDTVVIGTTGRLYFTSQEGRRYVVITDAYDREVRRIEATGPTWQFWPSSFYGEILNMVQCVRTGRPPLCDAQFGADCSAIVGAAYLSEKNGRRAVHLDEFREFARSIAQRYPNDPQAADDALVETLLSAVRKSEYNT